MLKVVLNILAFGGGVLGSVIIANGGDMAKFGYIPFLVSSSTSVALQWGEPTQRGLLYLSMFYVGVNAFGLCRWFGVL